tara:strand:- start:226 stop:480 length:255 start_codon:yes stop_codon:yes gene_type:complete
MVAGFLVKQILKHGAKKGTKKAKDFLDFVKKGKYKGKDIDKEASKIKKNELDLETMSSPSKKKMARGGLAKKGYGRAYMKGGKV